MTRISIFAALIAISSIFSVSVFVIPFTLQTLMIVLTAMILSPSEALWSVITYLVLGLLGLPVYSGFKSGFEGLLGPTGGFLISFPFAAIFISHAKEKLNLPSTLALNIVVGIGFVYVCGIGYLSWFASLPIANATKTMLVFIPIDLLKIVIATLVGTQIRKLQIFST